MTDLNGRTLLDLRMSNFDHSIDEGLREALRSFPNSMACYSGWNFCAYVWVEPDSDQFSCQIWQYKTLAKEIKRDSLEQIMAAVCEEFGDD